MKKSLMILALVAMVGLMGTAEAAKTKMYLVANSHPGAVDGAASVGVRVPVGNLSVDIWPMVSMAKVGSTTTTTIPFYIDAYMGNLGVAFASTGLTTTGATNKVQLQFAAEKMLNDDLGFGAYLNIVDYTLSGGSGTTATSGSMSFLSALQSYVIIGFDM